MDGGVFRGFRLQKKANLFAHPARDTHSEKPIIRCREEKRAGRATLRHTVQDRHREAERALENKSDLNIDDLPQDRQNQVLMVSGFQ